MSVRGTDALLLAEMLQVDGLPGVAITNEPIRHYADRVIEHLLQRHTPLYVRHGQLVRIQHKEDGTPFIETLSETALKGILARAMNFVRVSERKLYHVSPPDVLVKDLLTLGSWPFPPLDTIVEFPVFRPDGTLIDREGYDAATRIVYMPSSSLVIPPVPQTPTDDDVVNALALLDDMIGEFPYENQASYANALGLLLTPIIRQSINGHVPLALIDATRPGTGKSLLAETVSLVATGRQAAMMTAPYDDNEWRKRIASTLAEGSTIIVIDNVKARIQSASLDAALTSSVIKERILGQSKNGVYVQRATWMATGNNLQIGGDMPRRSYWIRMDAHTDKPWTRGGFKYDLEEWVPAHRGEIIAALLTLARAWFAAGKPAAHVPRLGSFQPWTDTIGGILGYTGLIDNFLGNLDALYEQADEEAMQWAGFLHALQDTYKDEPFLVTTLDKDIKAGASEHALVGESLFNALPDELADIWKGDFKRRLGKALASRVDSQFDESGLHLQRAGFEKRNNAVYWRVVAGMRVSEAPITLRKKNEILQTSLESLGGGLSGDIPTENGPGNEGQHTRETRIPASETVTPSVNWHAMNQTIAETEAAITHAYQQVGSRTHHQVRLLGVKRVLTPRGPGQLEMSQAMEVWVKLDGDDYVTVFDRPSDLERIIPFEEVDE